MTLNFPEAVNNAISGEVIRAAAAHTSEQEAGIQKALNSAVPATIAGIIGKIASPSGASQVIQLGKQAAATNILQQPTVMFAKNDPALEEKYHSILKEIMGDRATGIAHLISAHAGISNSTAYTLLTFLAPFSMSVLDKFVRDNNISEISLATQLNNQKYKVLAALPAGIGPIAGMLGFQVPESVSTAAAAELPHSRYDTSTAAETTVEEESKVMKILLPLFLGILLVVLAVYFFKGWRFDNKFDKVTAADSVKPIPVLFSRHTPVINSEPLYTGPPMTILELPNGTVMKVMKDDFEEKLVNFLQSDYTSLGNDSLKNIWFDISNLRFNNNGTLLYNGQQSLVNLIAILHAFPAARIKIAGYTDKAGDEKDNLRFSSNEAASLQSLLISAGLAKQVLGADGFGSANAKYPATDPEKNRFKDRRVSVSVRM